MAFVILGYWLLKNARSVSLYPYNLSQILQNTMYTKCIKECMSDSVTNYNYVGDTQISVSIKKSNANTCTLSEIFLTEILKSFSAF